MALLKGEGTHQILYGGADIFSGLRHNRGYLARPDHAGAFPTVLLVHGADGVTSSVKSFARRLARHGLAVVGPDLFGGARTPRRRPPPWPDSSRVASDISDAFHWTASADTQWVRPGLIGILALDQGSCSAIRFAESHDDVGGLVLVSPVFGGDLPDSQTPLLGFFGREDDVVDAESRRAVQRALGHGEWVLYGGVGHGLVDESAGDYRWDVAEDVLERTVEFFGRTLAG